MPRNANGSRKTRKRPLTATEPSTPTRPQLNAIYGSRRKPASPPSLVSPIVPVQWPSVPPNSTPYRSIVQRTFNVTAKELGLPPGVPPPIIARQPLPHVHRRPPDPITGFELSLPDLILLPGVIPPWEDDTPPISITSPPTTPPEIAALRAGFSSIKIALSPSTPPRTPDSQQTHPVDTPHTPDAHPSKRRRIDTNLNRPTLSARPLFQGGTSSLSLGFNATPPRASISRESPSPLNTSLGRPYTSWYPDQIHQQSHHDEQFDGYTPEAQLPLQRAQIISQDHQQDHQQYAQFLDRPSYVQVSSGTSNFNIVNAPSPFVESQASHNLHRTPRAGGWDRV